MLTLSKKMWWHSYCVTFNQLKARSYVMAVIMYAIIIIGGQIFFLGLINTPSRQLITHKPWACASDKQCHLRNLPKVSSQVVQVRIERELSELRAGLKPTTPQDCDHSWCHNFLCTLGCSL